MRSLWYGTSPRSSAFYIPAKWLYEWLTQWQLFPTCEHLCKIWIRIFLFIEAVSDSMRYLICSGKQKDIHCVKSRRAHLQRCQGSALPLALFFHYDLILTEPWHLLHLAYFWKIVQWRGQLISIFPSQGAYKHFVVVWQIYTWSAVWRECEDISIL